MLYIEIVLIKRTRCTTINRMIADVLNQMNEAIFQAILHQFHADGFCLENSTDKFTFRCAIFGGYTSVINQRVSCHHEYMTAL